MRSVNTDAHSCVTHVPGESWRAGLLFTPPETRSRNRRASGLGAGLAALIDRVDRVIAVDLSEEALRAAQTTWAHVQHIDWIQADVSRMIWPNGAFSAICAFGFTDWDFLGRVPEWIKPGGLFLYQGFSRRQLSVKPNLDPAWTTTPKDIAALFPDWEQLACEETHEAPFRVSFAAVSPDP